MVTTVPAQEHHQRFHAPLLPHTALGWWGVGLMFATLVGCPTLWAALTATIRHSDPDTHIRTALMVAIAVPSLVVGVLALVHRETRSVILIVLTALVAILIAWVAFFVISFATL